MKQDCYTFEYSTKTKKYKLIAYGAFSMASAIKRFHKNVRSTCLHAIWRNGLLVSDGFVKA